LYGEAPADRNPRSRFPDALCERGTGKLRRQLAHEAKQLTHLKPLLLQRHARLRVVALPRPFFFVALLYAQCRCIASRCSCRVAKLTQYTEKKSLLTAPRIAGRRQDVYIISGKSGTGR